MKLNICKGSIVAMITPFHEDGSVNFEVLTQLLERQIAAGTDGILTLGTTGEYSTMSHEEDAAVVAHTIKVVGGRVPSSWAAGSNCTATRVEKEHPVSGHGRRRAAAHLSLLQQRPIPRACTATSPRRRTQSTSPASFTTRPRPHRLLHPRLRGGASCQSTPNIVGIKEASGDMSYAMKIARCGGRISPLLRQ